MGNSTLGFTTLLLVAVTGTGCASGPAAPFDTMKNAQMTAYRLQNFEPPPSAAAPAAPGALIPGLPPEVQAWVQQGAQGLTQLIPPGILPPGMVPGATPAAPPPPDAPRFHGFRILGQTEVIDPNLKEELADILGDDDNFHNKHAGCQYSEMGLSFSSGPGVQNDLLISFSCNQVIAKSFAWPHPSTGMKPDTVKQLSDTVQKLWPPGT